MRDSVRNIMDEMQLCMEKMGLKPAEIYIDLDNDNDWLALSRRMAGPDVNIKVLTDKDEIKTILRENGKNSLIIDVRIPDICGIDLAEEIGLKERADSLFFISDKEITQDQHLKVISMGAQFVQKDDCFWDKLQSCSLQHHD